MVAMWIYDIRLNFKKIWEHNVTEGNSAHYVNTIFFYTVLKFILTDFFYFFDLGTHIYRVSVLSPKLLPICKERKPNAYGIPIKNECWFLCTNIDGQDSRATPTLAWKGETGN